MTGNVVIPINAYGSNNNTSSNGANGQQQYVDLGSVPAPAPASAPPPANVPPPPTRAELEARRDQIQRQIEQTQAKLDSTLEDLLTEELVGDMLKANKETEKERIREKKLRGEELTAVEEELIGEIIDPEDSFAFTISDFGPEVEGMLSEISDLNVQKVQVERQINQLDSPGNGQGQQTGSDTPTS